MRIGAEGEVDMGSGKTGREMEVEPGVARALRAVTVSFRSLTLSDFNAC